MDMTESDTSSQNDRVSQQTSDSRSNSKIFESVEVTLEAYLGEGTMTVGTLTALQPGSAVALDCELNHPVELRLKGVPVARGELIAVGNKFGVRIAEIAQWPD